MVAKLNLNIREGVLEVEGSESLVREIYNDFKQQLGTRNLSNPIGSANGKASDDKERQTKKKNQKTKSRSKSEPLKVDKTLNLGGADGGQPLKAYVEIYKPTSNLDRNVVFVGYLKDEMKLDKVGPDQVWTCYDHLGGKLPGNMKQSLFDTSSTRGGSRLNTDSLEDISLSVQGMNWLIERQSTNG